MRWLRAVGCALALTGVARTSAAGHDSVRVVATMSTSLSERIVREIESAGLAVELDVLPSPEQGTALVVVVSPDPQAPIEIWATDEAAMTPVASIPADGSDEIRALRVAELVRAFIFRPAPPPPPTPPSAPVSIRSAPPPISAALDAVKLDKEPTVRAAPPFDIGLAGAMGLQSAGLSMQIEVTAAYWPHESFGVGFFGSAPAVGADMEEPEGITTVRSTLLAAELTTAPIGRRGSFSLLVNPGLALDYVHISGDSDDESRNRTRGIPLGAAYARTELRVALAGPVRFKVSALAGSAFPGVEILVADRMVSRYAPLGAVSVGFVVEP